MITVKIPGMKDVKLSPHEFNLMITALKTHIIWDTGGMFGDGNSITDKIGMKRAANIIKKFGYK